MIFFLQHTFGIKGVFFLEHPIPFFCVSLQWISIPFAMSNEAFTTLDISENDWIGSVEKHFAGVWFDYAMLLICGGIPWQVYRRTPGAIT